jgi:uncharacterized membrane protein YhaH (DUF805 family)
MAGDHRFAPPVAQVEDIAPEAGHQPVRLWPASGRIGRLRLLAYGLGLYIGLIVITFVMGLVAGATGLPADLAVGIGIAIYAIGTVILLVQRSHDMNMAGWWSLAALIPLVGLVWVFKAGTPGRNRWGAPPPPNTLFVKIAGLAIPFLMGLGIVAAIALPAYSDYVKRAQGGVVGR